MSALQRIDKISSDAGTLFTPRSALRTPHSAGFTLIEIMLVVAILVIALGFSYPAISDMVHRAPITQATKDIMDACRHARAKAILSGQPVELRIFPHDLRIEVVTAPADVTPGTTPPAETAPPPSHYAPQSPFISSAKLSEEIRFEMVDVNFVSYKDADVARVRFYPNGTSDEMTIIMHANLEYRKISLEVVTALAQAESDVGNFLPH